MFSFLISLIYIIFDKKKSGPIPEAIMLRLDPDHQGATLTTKKTGALMLNYASNFKMGIEPTQPSALVAGTLSIKLHSLWRWWESNPRLKISLI